MWTAFSPAENGWYWMRYNETFFPYLPAGVSEPKLLMVFKDQENNWIAEDTVNCERYKCESLTGVLWSGPVRPPACTGSEPH